MASMTCRKCGEEGQFRPMEWKLRALIAVFAGLMVFILGLALTMVGLGLPLLVAAPIVAVVFLLLPWKRCHRCGHIGVW